MATTNDKTFITLENLSTYNGEIKKKLEAKQDVIDNSHKLSAEYVSGIPSQLQSLTIGSQTYNGSAPVTITAANLGLTGVLRYVGDSSTEPNKSGATVSGVSSWERGNVVTYGSTNKEYVLVGDTNVAANWRELGDEGSYVVKEPNKGLSTHDFTTALKTSVETAVQDVYIGTNKATKEGTAIKLPAFVTGDIVNDIIDDKGFADADDIALAMESVRGKSTDAAATSTDNEKITVHAVNNRINGLEVTVSNKVAIKPGYSLVSTTDITQITANKEAIAALDDKYATTDYIDTAMQGILKILDENFMAKADYATATTAQIQALFN